MGIAFSPGGAGWSYGGFMAFRRWVALRALNVDLDYMAGFNEERPARTWSQFDHDPITLLLNHSDCDGELSADQCRLVAPRLREILADCPHEYDKAQGLKLADGMDEAAEKNVPLLFH